MATYCTRYASPPSSTSTARPSAARRSSSSPTAVATQVPGYLRRSSVRTVTRPPGPRVTTGSPEGSLWNETGPRLAATTRRRPARSEACTPRPPCVAVRVRPDRRSFASRTLPPYLTRLKVGEEPEVVAQQPRREELATHVLLAQQSHAPVLLGLRQDLEAPLRTLSRGLDEIPGDAVLDLQRDPRYVAADGRPRLPQPLGDGEAEALARGLLHDHVGVALEGVDLHRAHVVEVGQDEHVGVGAHVLDHLLEIFPALRVVARHRSDESELHGRVLRLDGTVDVDDAQRVLPRVEARDLQQKRSLDVDAELTHDVGGVLGGELHVLGRQRVDGRGDLAHRHGEAPRHVVAHGVDGRVVAVDGREQVVVS